jgi:hypothetical protein
MPFSGGGQEKGSQQLAGKDGQGESRGMKEKKF